MHKNRTDSAQQERSCASSPTLPPIGKNNNKHHKNNRQAANQDQGTSGARKDPLPSLNAMEWNMSSSLMSGDTSSGLYGSGMLSSSNQSAGNTGGNSTNVSQPLLNQLNQLLPGGSAGSGAGSGAGAGAGAGVGAPGSAFGPAMGSSSSIGSVSTGGNSMVLPHGSMMPLGTGANVNLSANLTVDGTSTSSVPTGGSSGGMQELLPLVVQLTNPEQRETVLLELSKKRESFSDLAPILWHSVGTVSALLQEIVSIYSLLWPPTLTAHASNRVCNALALLQCVASHPDTRSLFLAAHVPLYLYPFLNTQSKSRPFEYLRLTSLGVIGALVKMDDPDVINFLLQTEIIPLCLRIMESGSELSKTVATFIVQKVLLDEIGLLYVCATAERFYAVSTVLYNMIGSLTVTPSVRLLKHIVRCYWRLSDNARAREALRACLPMSLRDDTFSKALRDDITVKKWLSQLLNVVGPPVDVRGDQGGVPGTGGMTGSSAGSTVGGGSVNGNGSSMGMPSIGSS